MQKWRHIVSGSLKANHKEAIMTAEKYSTYKMGMQVSFGEHTEISVPEPVRIAEKGYRQCVP